MRSSEFAYWLMGWFELNKTIDHREGATQETLDMIERHLKLVFVHDLDPKQGPPEVQQQLQEIHDPPEEPIMRC